MTLLPCPFCSGQAEIVRAGTRRQSTIIACSDCGCRLESPDEGDQYGDSWNHRAAHEPRADLETIAAIFQHWLDFDALRWREHCKEEPTDDTIMSRSLLETPRRSVVKAWVAALRRPTQPPPAEQAGCEYSDDGEHECKHCDAKHVTQTAGRFIESIWEVTDDCEENAQTGDVTMDQASWQKIMQAIWDLGGRHRERLSNFGYSPPTKEV